jgi:hypothetical protein
VDYLAFDGQPAKRVLRRDDYFEVSSQWAAIRDSERLAAEQIEIEEVATISPVAAGTTLAMGHTQSAAGKVQRDYSMSKPFP